MNESKWAVWGQWICYVGLELFWGLSAIRLEY